MSDIWSAPTVAFVSIAALGAAVLLGFAGAAAIATNTGQTVTAAVGLLVLLSCAVEGAHMMTQARLAQTVASTSRN